jgi:hypothetical protein
MSEGRDRGVLDWSLVAPQPQPGAVDELAEHGVPEVWRHSIVTLWGVIDDLDR